MDQFKIDDQVALEAAIMEWFESERGLIDVWVFDTKTEDWQKMLDFVSRIPYEREYTYNDKPANLPASANQVFDASPRDFAKCLSVKIDGIDLHSYFFCPEEIDFDIDPREVKQARALQQIFEFFRKLADLLSKDVVLTPEGMREFVIFRLRPGCDVIDYRQSA